MIDVTLQKSTPIDFGVDFQKIYHECCSHLDQRVPRFHEMYDCYCTAYIEERMRIADREIDQTLQLLRAEHGNEVFDVEHGFHPPAHGALPEHTFFFLLVESGIFFERNGSYFNKPIVGVW